MLSEGGWWLVFVKIILKVFYISIIFWILGTVTSILHGSWVIYTWVVCSSWMNTSLWWQMFMVTLCWLLFGFVWSFFAFNTYKFLKNRVTDSRILIFPRVQKLTVTCTWVSTDKWQPSPMLYWMNQLILYFSLYIFCFALTVFKVSSY